jgi:hypothetical protein
MTDFDRIAASAPLNAQAGASASHGTHYAFETTRLTFDTCPPLLPRAQLITSRGATDKPDYTGQVIGRLTVLGVMQKPGGRKKWIARWVCRCTCGTFNAIKTKHMGEGIDRCDACTQAALMRGEKINGKTIQYRDERIKWVSA